MNPQLKYLNDFEALLKDYKPPSETKNLLAQVKFVTIASPTGVGHSTITLELIKTGKYHYLVSDTTRPPRSNNGVMEKDGADYWFKSETDFLNGLRDGRYLEAAIIHNQQVSGVNLEELLKAKADNKIILADIDVHGIKRITQMLPSIKSFFMLPPSFEEWMRRLEKRGHMDAPEREHRFKSAVIELREVLNSPNYIYIINDKLEPTVELVASIIDSDKYDADYQSRAKHLAQNLLAQTKEYLNANNFN